MGSLAKHFLVTNSLLEAVVFTLFVCYATPVLGVVPFNMSFDLLCPNESFAAYTALVLKFFHVTSFMLFKVLLHLSAEVVANSTDEHLARVCFGVCH